MSLDGTAWIYVKEKQDPSSASAGIGSSQGQCTDQQDDLIMVPMQLHKIRVHPAARTLSFSKERGYDVCVGDCVEIARGKWFGSKGLVHVVDFDKASLDLVCDTDGQTVSIQSLQSIHESDDLSRSMFRSPFAARLQSVLICSCCDGSAVTSG